MTRYFLELSYRGSAYHGWQIQQNAPSVQEIIQKSLATLLKESVLVVGAGRTDTGVHASFYIAHFDTNSTRDLQQDSFCYHLNAILPKDIAIHRIYPVKGDLHARFSAIEREYKYYIATKKNPFSLDRAYTYTQKLNMETMQEAADLLLKYTDFTSFAKLHTDTKTNICKIAYAGFEKENDTIIFTIRADRFLRNMVRAVIGTLLEVGKEKISVDDFREIIEKKDRSAAKSSAQSQGLFLTNIVY